MPAEFPDAKSLFLHAVDILNADERAAYLDVACRGRPELRARVEELLRAQAQPDSLLDRPLPESDAPLTFVPSGPHDTAPETSLDFLEPCQTPGRLGRLGEYEVLQVIGRGGMGIVFRAYDPKLNRVVAIKVIAPELSAIPMAVKRFLREARAAAAVSHDHVVTIHAIDDTHRPPFIVMECIDGKSLQDKLDRVGALELHEILRIGLQTAAGLAAAHKQGLVHRDIKPANILLENGVERVKLTDFGLARAVDDVRVTVTGQISGTPAYMSPEQAQGHAVNHRSDLFSLGSVLYALCAGRPPFRAETPLATLRRVADDDPRSLCEVNPGVPAWLESIIFKLLAKDPGERFQTAAEVSDLLAAHLAHLQDPAAVPQPPEVPARQRRQTVGPAIAGALSTPGKKPEWRTGLLAGLAIALVVVALAFAAYRATDLGMLVVESEDEQATLLVHELLHHSFDGNRGHTDWKYPGTRISGSGRIRLRSGAYFAFLEGRSNDLSISQTQFVLGRGEQVVVRVVRKKSAGSVLPAAQNSTPKFTEFAQWSGHTDTLDGLTYSVDGRFLFSGGGEKLIYQWDVQEGRVIRKIPVPDYPTGFAAHPDGKRLITAQAGGGMTLWNVETGRAEREYVGHTNRVGKIAVTRDGTRLLSGGQDGLVRLWNIETGEPVHSFSDGYSPAVALSADDRLAASSANWGVRIWRTDSGETLHKIPRNTVTVESAAFSPDGTFLATGDGKGLVQLWDVLSGRELLHIDAPKDRVTSLLFTPDGKGLITGGLDRTLRYFEVERGVEVAAFVTNSLCVNYLALSPDGQTLATAGGMAVTFGNDQWITRKDGDYAIRLWHWR